MERLCLIYLGFMKDIILSLFRSSFTALAASPQRDGQICKIVNIDFGRIGSRTKFIRIIIYYSIVEGESETHLFAMGEIPTIKYNK